MYVSEFVPPAPISKEDLELLETLRSKYKSSTNARFHHYDKLYEAVDKIRSSICDTENTYSISITYADCTRMRVTEISVRMGDE